MDQAVLADPCTRVNELAALLPAGPWINLLVTDVPRAVAFQRSVLGAEASVADDGFAIMRAGGVHWMLHSDGTYGDHPMVQLALRANLRGGGIELAASRG